MIKSQFKEWVLSLNWNDLSSALEFELDTERNEDQLLLEMVREQAPRPTPIHPYALPGKKPSRAVFDDDGQNSLQRILRARIHQPRLFQWTETGRKQPSFNSRNKRDRKSQPIYDVLVRKFHVHGDRLGLGCTHEQRSADENLVFSTVLVEDPVALSRGVSCRRVRFSHVADANRSKREMALRLLHVASRGLFLSTAGSTAPAWLQPTERYFSLSMYLSFRFERSLWEKFSRQAPLEPSPCQWMLNGTTAPSFVLESMIHKAIFCALATKLRSDRNELESPNPPRLCLEFLLEHQCITVPSLIETRTLDAVPPRQILDVNRLLECNLILLGSPFDEFRRETCRHFHGFVVTFFQRQVEAAFLAEPQVSSSVHPKEKKRRRQRRKQKQRSDPTPMEMNVGLDLIPEASDNDESEAHYGHGHICYDFPNQSTSARDRSRNTILCLSILEDILNSTFEAVVLEPDTDRFGDGSNDEFHSRVKPRSDGQQCTDKLIDPVSMAFPATSSTLDAGVSDVQLQHHKGDRDKTHLTSEVPLPEVLLTSVQAPALESLSAHYGTIGGAFYHKPEPGFVWDVTDDDWGRIRGFPSREQSLLADFFKEGVEDLARADSGSHDAFVASSTAASVDSCSDKADGDDELVEMAEQRTISDPTITCTDNQTTHMEVLAEEGSPSQSPAPIPQLGGKYELTRSPSPVAPASPPPTISPILVSLGDLKDLQKDALHLKDSSPELLDLPEARKFLSLTASSLPSSPRVRPDRISPAMVNGDLVVADRLDDANRKESSRDSSSLSARRLNSKGRLMQSRDDQDVRPSVHHRKSTDALSSYRNSFKLVKAMDDHDIRHSSIRSIEPVPSRSRLSNRSAFSWVRASPADSFPQPVPGQLPFDVGPRQMCTRSEIALDGQEESHNWHISHRSLSAEEGDNNTVTKDGSTTITSLSQREAEELSALREERNAFRDMCLTLGAEVAKLNNLLASQRGGTSAPRHGYSYGMAPNFHAAAFFGPEAFSMAPRARTMAAMSDAGFRGEHESLASEDDLGTRQMRGDVAVAGTPFAGSDASMDPTSGRNVLQLPQSMLPHRDFAAIAVHGTQSRLAKEIFLFVDNVNAQLNKQEPKRRVAVERMTRLVNAVWPRAQVKLYGSHVTGLCLPSSDLDFVIRLPEVHKKAVAVAPGALEGRNAINESKQKKLARKLKGESWIDPRSLKLIERTVVPVIKVSTKDTKAKMIQLDITFDAPEHHGSQAVLMVAQILDELPLIRPLVLVLKQFLLDRGLLTAYTGGLSSYCLFLMVTRYLQEQSSAYGDVGSLLMGFLDFFGNHFEPRSTGISVRRREYFARPTYGVTRFQAAPQSNAATPIWAGQSAHNMNPVIAMPVSSFGSSTSFRRNSFSDKASTSDPMRGMGPLLNRSHLFQTTSPVSHQSLVNPLVHEVPLHSAVPPAAANNASPVDGSFPLDHRIPYTFDPLFVEDPLSETNNVGRNAFRFLQVQRAFSDAHRALVAALEWDLPSSTMSGGGGIHGGGGVAAASGMGGSTSAVELSDGMLALQDEYPLLKCLLQSEDVVFDL